MAFKRVAPSSAPRQPRPSVPGTSGAATSSVPTSSVTSSACAQACDIGTCQEKPSAYIDENLDRKRNAADAMASMQMLQGPAPFVDAYLPTPTMHEHGGLSSHCRWPEFNDQPWHGQGDRVHVGNASGMNYDGSKTFGSPVLDESGRLGLGPTSAGLAVPVQQPTFWPPGLDPTPKPAQSPDGCGNAHMLETSRTFQRSEDCGLGVHACGAPHLVQDCGPRRSPKRVTFAPDISISTRPGAWSEFGQEQPGYVHAHTQGVQRTLNSKVSEKDTGSFANMFQQEQPRYVHVHSQQRTLKTKVSAEDAFRGQGGGKTAHVEAPRCDVATAHGPEYSYLSSVRPTQVASSVGMEQSSARPSARIRDMSAYVFDGSFAEDHSGPGGGHECDFQDRRFSHFEAVGPSGIAEQCPDQFSVDDKFAPAGPAALLGEKFPIGTIVQVVNRPSSGLNWLCGQVVGYHPVTGDHQIEFISQVPITNEGDVAIPQTATHAGDVRVEEKPTKDNSLANPGVQNANRSRAPPATKSSERVQDKPVAEINEPDTKSSQAASAKTTSTLPTPKSGTSSKSGTGTVASESTRCLQNGAGPASVEQRALNVRPREKQTRGKYRSRLLHALQLDDVGVKPSMDSSGSPAFLRERQQAHEPSSSAAPSPPSEAAVPVPRFQ